ncbi:hypothetical protein Aperf_G00000087944 [Anoplocephala perfoliata]
MRHLSGTRTYTYPVVDVRPSTSAQISHEESANYTNAPAEVNHVESQQPYGLLLQEEATRFPTQMESPVGASFECNVPNHYAIQPFGELKSFIITSKLVKFKRNSSVLTKLQIKEITDIRPQGIAVHLCLGQYSKGSQRITITSQFHRRLSTNLSNISNFTKDACRSIDVQPQLMFPPKFLLYLMVG